MRPPILGLFAESVAFLVVFGAINMAVSIGSERYKRQMYYLEARTDAYPHFNVIRDGRSDHGTIATHLGRCDTVILELPLVGFLSPLARKFDTYP